MLLLPVDKSQIISIKDILIEGWRRHNLSRTGLHISDLVSSCPRRVCFERIDDNPQLSEKSIAYFENGVSWHSHLEHILGTDFQCEKEFLYRCKNGQVVVAHPDAIYEKNGVKVILEIKTTTHNTDKPSKAHLAQIKSYMSIVPNVDYGKLLYVIIGSDSDTHFIEHLVLFNYKNEKEEILEQLESSAEKLQVGISLGQPNLVPHIAKDFSLNWLCKICAYKNRCDQMRIEAGELKLKK